MPSFRNRISAITIMLALGFGSAGISAQPSENRGNNGYKGKHAQHEDKKHSDGRYETRDGRQITVEEAVIRAIFRDERSFIEADTSLPPGIRKNLARGKPLPPGIAKKFDGRVNSRLPSYPGYDWRQVGTDAVLINTTNGIVEAIIDNILR
jgi:Ni/Co efflux regulator RcnB